MTTWQTKSSKVVYENPWMGVREDKVITPTGKDGTYGVVSAKHDAVFVVPVDDENNVYIIQQEHYTTREMAWQCVAGGVDEGESIESAAKRELLEEAGLQAKIITILSKSTTASGMTSFKSTLCLAQGLTEDKSQFDHDEIAAVKKVPLSSVKDMILSNEIANTESIAALLLALAHLEKTTKE